MVTQCVVVGLLTLMLCPNDDKDAAIARSSKRMLVLFVGLGFVVCVTGQRVIRTASLCMQSSGNLIADLGFLGTPLR